MYVCVGMYVGVGICVGVYSTEFSLPCKYVCIEYSVHLDEKENLRALYNLTSSYTHSAVTVGLLCLCVYGEQVCFHIQGI